MKQKQKMPSKQEEIIRRLVREKCYSTKKDDKTSCSNYRENALLKKSVVSDNKSVMDQIFVLKGIQIKAYEHGLGVIVYIIFIDWK